MVQAIDNPIAANFLTDAVVERHNFSQLNKTRIRFRIQLKKSTKSAAPKWADVLKAEVSEIESDLVKVTNSEVGLRGIKVFKKLDETAAQLRQEIASVQEWMSADTGDWVCPIDLAPLVWSQLINIRDHVAPGLRNQLKVDYEAGLVDYQERIDQFLSLNTWELSLDKQESVKTNLLKSFPLLSELEDYLQVIIGRPVIIPALSEQLNQQQAECLEQITRFIQQYLSVRSFFEPKSNSLVLFFRTLLRKFASNSTKKTNAQISQKISQTLKSLQSLNTAFYR